MGHLCQKEGRERWVVSPLDGAVPGLRHRSCDRDPDQAVLAFDPAGKKSKVRSLQWSEAWRVLGGCLAPGPNAAPLESMDGASLRGLSRRLPPSSPMHSQGWPSLLRASWGTSGGPGYGPQQRWGRWSSQAFQGYLWEARDGATGVADAMSRADLSLA